MSIALQPVDNYSKSCIVLAEAADMPRRAMAHTQVVVLFKLSAGQARPDDHQMKTISRVHEIRFLGFWNLNWTQPGARLNDSTQLMNSGFSIISLHFLFNGWSDCDAHTSRSRFRFDYFVRIGDSYPSYRAWTLSCFNAASFKSQKNWSNVNIIRCHQSPTPQRTLMSFSI